VETQEERHPIRSLCIKYILNNHTHTSSMQGKTLYKLVTLGEAPLRTATCTPSLTQGHKSTTQLNLHT